MSVGASARPARVAGVKAARLPLPAGVAPIRVNSVYAATIAAYHLIALLAFVPWFFSWTGVVLAVLGHFIIGGLGISLCYHRLLTHRGLVLPKWLEHTFAVFGVLSAEDTPARWVAIHRRHHEHADDEADPHSPNVNFFWGHVGWVVTENRELPRMRTFDRYAKDVLRDKFYARLERTYLYIWLNLASWGVFFGAGFIAQLLLGGTTMQAIQFGASLLVWGVFVRTVVHWHATWAVNSVTHRFGYRNYETDEASRNNILVGLLANGEGWHNNHHADPRSACYQHRWWEFDFVYAVILLLSALGLAHKIAMPSPHLAHARRTPITTRGRNEGAEG
jgi:stearoyl-CoA desaturase (delta-9 desaturase)